MTALSGLRLRHLLAGGAGLLASAVMLSSSGGSTVVRLAYWPVASAAYPGPAAYAVTGVITGGTPLTGDSTLAGHAQQVDVAAWSFQLNNTGTTIGSGASAGKVNCAPLEMTKSVDSSSVPLLRALLQGSLDRLDLYGVRTDLGTDFLHVRLGTVHVTQLASDSDAGVGSEKLSLSYGTINVSYRPQNPDGSFANPVSSGFDCAAQKIVSNGGGTATTTTLSSAGNEIYGGTVSLKASVTGSTDGTVTFSEGSTVLCSSVALSGGAASCAFTATAAGQHSYHAAYNPASLSYDASSADLSVTVAPAPLSVTADNRSRTYGAADPGFTASYAGFVRGDTPAALGGTLAFSTNETAASPVGTYSITPSGLTSANYAITFLPGTLTVTPAPLTITAANATRLYGAADPAFTAGYQGFVNGEGPGVLTGTLTFVVNRGAPYVHVGTYPITPRGVSDPNYAIKFVDGALSITPAPLTVTANDASRTYGAADPAFTASYAGFVLGDTPAVLGGTLVFTPAATVSSPVGTYALTPSGLTSTDYAITFKAGTLTVTPAPLQIKAVDASRYYGYPEPAFSVTYSGFVLGEGPSVLGGTLTFISGDAPNSPAGSTWLITPGGLTATNYTITFLAGHLSITKAPLTIAAEDKTRQFGTPNPPLTVTYTGFVLGEGPSVLHGSLSLTTPAQFTSSVGDYPILVGGVTADNYAITFRGGTLHITPFVVTVVPGAEQRGAKKALVGGQVLPPSLAGQTEQGTMDFYVDGVLAQAGVPINAGAVAVTEVADSKAATHTLTVVFHSTNVDFTGGTATLTFGKNDDKSAPDPAWLERTGPGKK